MTNSDNIILPWTKTRTIFENRGEKNAVPRVISCLIRHDQRRASPIRDCPRLLPCADRAWSSMISHVEQCSSRRESRGWFFFFVQGSTTTKKRATMTRKGTKTVPPSLQQPSPTTNPRAVYKLKHGSNDPDQELSIRSDGAIPMHSRPFPMKPMLQEHQYEPSVFSHRPSELWQVLGPRHSSVSNKWQKDSQLSRTVT